MTGKTKWMALGCILGILVIAGYLLLGHSSQGSTLGQSVNAGIDNLLMTATRLSELPIFILLACAGVLAGGIAIVVTRFAESRGRVVWGRVASATCAAMLLIGLALLVDRKIGQLQTQMTDLRQKLGEQRMAMLGIVNDKSSPAPIAAAPGSNAPSVPALISQVPAAKPAPIVTPIVSAAARPSTPVKTSTPVAKVS
ncbi:MAG TPA: hypothetical protein VGN88_01675, partial [Phycisphaerae bacterium]